MLRKVSSSRLTFTKNNNALLPTLDSASSIFQSMGMLELKRHETDNAASDGNVLKNIFLNC